MFADNIQGSHAKRPKDANFAAGVTGRAQREMLGATEIMIKVVRYNVSSHIKKITTYTT